jgi:hypothetical protein
MDRRSFSSAILAEGDVLWEYLISIPALADVVLGTPAA